MKSPLEKNLLIPQHKYHYYDSKKSIRFPRKTNIQTILILKNMLGEVKIG